MKKPKNIANKSGRLVAQLETRINAVRVFDSHLESKAARQLARKLYEFARYLDQGEK